MRIQVHTPDGIEEREITEEEARALGFIKPDWSSIWAVAKSSGDANKMLICIARFVGLEKWNWSDIE